MVSYRCWSVQIQRMLGGISRISSKFYVYTYQMSGIGDITGVRVIYQDRCCRPLVGSRMNSRDRAKAPVPGDCREFGSVGRADTDRDSRRTLRPRTRRNQRDLDCRAGRIRSANSCDPCCQIARTASGALAGRRENRWPAYSSRKTAFVHDSLAIKFDLQPATSMLKGDCMKLRSCPPDGGRHSVRD